MRNIITFTLLAITQTHAMSFFQSEQPKIKVPKYAPPPVEKKPMA